MSELLDTAAPWIGYATLAVVALLAALYILGFVAVTAITYRPQFALGKPKNPLSLVCKFPDGRLIHALPVQWWAYVGFKRKWVLTLIVFAPEETSHE